MGLAYTILATTMNSLRHLLNRGQGGEERRKSIDMTKTHIVKMSS
jgi:hypothetical protein